MAKLRLFKSLSPKGHESKEHEISQSFPMDQQSIQSQHKDSALPEKASSIGMNEENNPQFSSIKEVDVNDDDDLYEAEPNARDASSLSSEDLVIALMGVTGSGKSTFISLLADQAVKVGHSLMSCTTEVGVYSFKYDENQTIYLIDTPGFDDTTRSDTDVLKDIAFFLTTAYSNKVKLGGIIYLHRITDPRMGGSALKNLYMFQRLCGDRGLSSVILATTMWGALESTESGKEIGLQREQELRKPEFWGSMIECNSEIVRHDGTADSAHTIVSRLVDRGTDVVLDIQVQLVDENKTLDETSAGKYLVKELLEARKRFERDIADYKESMKVAMQEKDEAMLQALKKEKEAAEAKEKARLEDWQTLNITVKQLAQEKDKEYKALFESLEKKQKTTIQLEQERQSQTRMFEAQVQRLEKALREGERRHRAELAELKMNQISKTEEEIARIDRILLQNQRLWEERERDLQDELNKEKRRRRREEEEYRSRRRFEDKCMPM